MVSSKVFKITSAAVLLSSGPGVNATSSTTRRTAGREADHITIPMAPVFSPAPPAAPARSAATTRFDNTRLDGAGIARPVNMRTTATRSHGPTRSDRNTGIAGTFITSLATATTAHGRPIAGGHSPGLRGRGAAANAGAVDGAAGMLYDGVSQLMDEAGRRFQNLRRSFRSSTFGRNRNSNNRNTNTTNRNNNSNTARSVTVAPRTVNALWTVGEESEHSTSDSSDSNDSAGPEMTETTSEVSTVPSRISEIDTPLISGVQLRRDGGPVTDVNSGVTEKPQLQKRATAPELLLRRASGSLTNIFCRASSRSRVEPQTESGAAGTSSAAGESDSSSQIQKQGPRQFLRRRATAGDAESLSLEEKAKRTSDVQIAAFKLPKDKKADDEFFHQCMFCLSKFGDAAAKKAKKDKKNGLHSATNSGKSSIASTSDEEENDVCQRCPPMESLESLEDAGIDAATLSQTIEDAVSELNLEECDETEDPLEETEDDVSYDPTTITPCGHKFHTGCLQKHIEMQIRQKMEEEGVNPLSEAGGKKLCECPHPFCKKKLSKKWAKQNGFLSKIEEEMKVKDEERRQREALRFADQIRIERNGYRAYIASTATTVFVVVGTVIIIVCVLL